MIILPTIFTTFNLITTILLLLGFLAIKRKDEALHKKYMLSAVGSTCLFLIGYLTHHYQVGSVPYPYYDWTRTVYFTILIPHVILAAVMVPFILTLLWNALKGRFEKHARLAKYVWPVWMFVSVTGIIIYLMLYLL